MRPHVTGSSFREARPCTAQVPEACESFASAHAAQLSRHPRSHAAFVVHLLTLADAGLLPTERMDACLALIQPAAPSALH